MENIIIGVLTVILSIITVTLTILTIVFGIIRAIKGSFRKTFIVLLITALLFGVIDFFAIYNLGQIKNDENVTIRQEGGKIIITDNPIRQLFMSDDEKIDILSNNIIQKIKTKDYETIKNIFSKDAVNNIQNIDEAINELISTANENITNVEPQMNRSETHWDTVQPRTTYRFSIAISTECAKYNIGLDLDYENPFNSETLGINRMVITDQNKNTIILVDNENLNKGY